MSGFYKMDPAKWDFGTSELSLEEEAAYLRIVNAIHKHDAPVPDNDRVLAGMFRVSTRKARSLVDALVHAGKVTIEDGKIWNERARSDLVHRGFTSISRAEMGAKGGRTRAENAAKALKDKEKAQAIASSRIEENRIEKKEAKASSQKQRGSRLSPDFSLPADWREWAASEGMSLSQADTEGLKFRDYWVAKPGREAIKMDWLATWRNWVRLALSRSPPASVTPFPRIRAQLPQQN